MDSQVYANGQLVSIIQMDITSSHIDITKYLHKDGRECD